MFCGTLSFPPILRSLETGPQWPIDMTSDRSFGTSSLRVDYLYISMGTLVPLLEKQWQTTEPECRVWLDLAVFGLNYILYFYNFTKLFSGGGVSIAWLNG